MVILDYHSNMLQYGLRDKTIIQSNLITQNLSHLLFPFDSERPLEVVEPIKDVKAKEKGSATLSCKFSVSPKEVSWFKGQTLLAVSDKYSLKQEAVRAQLTIQMLTGEDTGEYRCQSGPAETKATLTVEGTFFTALG